MAASVLVDAGFLIALLIRDDSHHRWAESTAERFSPPWQTCEAVLSEAFHLVGRRGTPVFSTLLRRGALLVSFGLTNEIESVLKLLHKYADLPMSLADACLVRMSELATEPILLTTDADFRVYRRHSRQVIPSELPT